MPGAGLGLGLGLGLRLGLGLGLGGKDVYKGLFCLKLGINYLSLALALALALLGPCLAPLIHTCPR